MKLHIAAALLFSLSAQAETIKIGLVLSTLQEERYQKDQKYFTDEAKKLGFTPIVVSADNNPQTQTAKVENLLSQGVKALVIQPVNSDAAANLGTALLASGRPAEAVAFFERALQLSPAMAEAHFNLAAALRTLGRTDEAAAHQAEAVRLRPDLRAAPH